MKLQVPIILGIVVIILFVICLFMNRDARENFTSLIGTANNNYSTKESLIDELLCTSSLNTCELEALKNEKEKEF